jgi:ribosomal protein S17
MLRLYTCSHHQAENGALNNKTIKIQYNKTVEMKSRLYINVQLYKKYAKVRENVKVAEEL